MNNCQGPILLVEDNADDLFFMKRAIRAAEIQQRIDVVTDGEQAIEYLSRMEETLPCLVLLDLKLPKKSGLEVLEWIRSQPRTRALVVIVLTTSKESSDIARAYQLWANAYLVKPSIVEELSRMVRAIKAFWLSENYFPGDPPVTA